MRASPTVSSLAVLLPLAVPTRAQDLEGYTRVATTGPVQVHRLDLDTGALELVGLRVPGVPGEACFANDVDEDPAYGPGPGSSVFDALLFPATDELFDWGIKSCNGSNFVESITIGFSSQAIPTSQGGPGGHLILRVYERAFGFGVFGKEVASIELTGLPSSGGAGGTPPVAPKMVRVDLGSQAFFLPDGPIGWSYENADGLSGPLLVDTTIANGTQNYLDVYRPGPAKAGSYLGTYTFPAGGTSGDPLENSLWIVINEDHRQAQILTIAAGSNPLVLVSTAPLVGSSWDVRVDLSSFPTARATLLAISAGQIVPVPTRFGELVVDLDALLGPPLLSATGTYSFPIPTDAALVGLGFVAQAAVSSTSSGVQLTNGLDLVIGTTWPSAPRVASR